MSGWNHSQCEACWIESQVSAEYAGILDGKVDYSVEIRRPVLLREPEIERCCWCGKFTIFGLYVREDPKVLPLHHTAHRNEDL